MLPVIFALAWPTMLEELMQTLVQYIDTAMETLQIDVRLGTEATAAVGATSTVGWMVGSSISALGVGFLAYIAKACGAGRKQEAHQASAQAAMVACIVGALFTALTLSLSPMVPVWMQVDPAIRELVFLHSVRAHAPPHGQHPLRHGAAGCWRHQNPHAGGRIDEPHQHRAELPADLPHPGDQPVFPHRQRIRRGDGRGGRGHRQRHFLHGRRRCGGILWCRPRAAACGPMAGCFAPA